MVYIYLKFKPNNYQKFHVISGKQHGNRIESRILEEKIQDAVALGHRRFEIIAYGQHGIGGRLWTVGDEAVYMKINGHSGQRLGSFGFPNTVIESMGPASDDVGWLNAGAEIIIHGNGANGTANGMAQGKVLVDGNIGARGMTMTKHNPRFDPPELWVMGSVGDYFGEFMAGGIAVICGLDAQKPRTLPLPGDRHLVTALDFLSQSRTNAIRPGKQVVIIGAGNVGCDVATEAFRLGAEKVTLIDVQEPLSFGAERNAAEALGAVFKWPCFTDKITENGVILKNGEVIDADTTIISIGDIPDLDFLPPEVAVDNEFIRVNEYFQTTDPAIFAVGDAVKPGLLTDAIGAGRKAAGAIIDILSDRPPFSKSRPMIDRSRVATQYFDPRVTAFGDLDQCGSQCSSCGTCRDCEICVAACPQTAISRIENQSDDFEYVVDADRCIGCGFCTGACPCGIWNLVENEPLE